MRTFVLMHAYFFNKSHLTVPFFFHDIAGQYCWPGSSYIFNCRFEFRPQGCIMATTASVLHWRGIAVSVRSFGGNMDGRLLPIGQTRASVSPSAERRRVSRNTLVCHFVHAHSASCTVLTTSRRSQSCCCGMLLSKHWNCNFRRRCNV